MKKLVFLMAAVLMFGSYSFAQKSGSKMNNGKQMAKNDFMKSKDGTWAGKDMMWYKLDKDAKVWESKDGKKWAASKEGMWQDKQGHWLKIGEGKLWWSADDGKTWSEVPNWQWEGEDGTWYKFDKDWSLWAKKSMK